MGHETTNFKALGIFCEDDEDELHRRQLAINEHYDLDWCDLENMGWYSGVAKENALHIFNREYWQWDPSQFFQEVHDVASDGGYQMIVLDSLHDLFAGNENARPEVRRFIQMLHSLACDIDGTVVLSAHPSKAGRADGTGESGSTAWNNSVRSRLYLTRPKDDEDNE
ncbi:MAG: AAA family ATPase, partial [Chloroflexi bacterium]|nr:AAA family ATPase [Chloroflexota bacterium]